MKTTNQQAEKQSEPEKPDSVARLRRLHEQGKGLASGEADAYLAEVHEDRGKWRSLIMG